MQNKFRRAVTAIYHIHIPRTAGSSVHRALFAFAKANGPALESANVEEIVRAGSAPALVTGHFNLDPRLFGRDRIFFVPLRDPVERVASLIRFIAATPAHRLHGFVRDCDGDPVEIYRHEDRGWQFDDWQVRQLLPDPYIPAGANQLATALRRLARADVIACTSPGLGAGLARLGRRVGFSFGPPPVVNASEPAPLSRAGRDAIRRHNRLDAKLYGTVRAAEHLRMLLRIPRLRPRSADF